MCDLQEIRCRLAIVPGLGESAANRSLQKVRLSFLVAGQDRKLATFANLTLGKFAACARMWLYRNIVYRVWWLF